MHSLRMKRQLSPMDLMRLSPLPSSINIHVISVRLDGAGSGNHTPLSFYDVAQPPKNPQRVFAGEKINPIPTTRLVNEDDADSEGRIAN